MNLCIIIIEHSNRPTLSGIDTINCNHNHFTMNKRRFIKFGLIFFILLIKLYCSGGAVNQLKLRGCDITGVCGSSLRPLLQHVKKFINNRLCVQHIKCAGVAIIGTRAT